MKTNVIISRQMGDFEIKQRTMDGYFEANELLSMWNKTPGNTRRDMDRFVSASNTKEFIEALSNDIAMSQKCDMADFKPIISIKGRNTKNGKTKDQVWMHPILFIKFAMWINPSFEVSVIKFVRDQMIEFRKDAGDLYRNMASAVTRINSCGIPMQEMMSKIANMLNWTAFNDGNPGARNRSGSDSGVNELIKLQDMISSLIEYGAIKQFSDIKPILSKEWIKRWSKKSRCLI